MTDLDKEKVQKFITESSTMLKVSSPSVNREKIYQDFLKLAQEICGRENGSRTSAKKKASSATNGKKGGRPRAGM